ncbi:hypothetical protein ACFYZB_44935 [Streptomyces sp. NPDC001852]|uniref:hypothetical protein n=1 Tax=Streptomyces sp. NPDC001852 TaxID=3364619 RepID=UPI0036D142B6
MWSARTSMAAAAALPLMLATPVAASAQLAPAAAHASGAAQVEEAVVNCVDDNSTSQEIGDNLFVLSTVDPQETEGTPTDTAKLVCNNSQLSSTPVTVIATANDGTTQTATIPPGGQWTSRTATTIPRMYHSVATLIPGA